MALDDKIIVITGGTSGVGYQLVSELCATNQVIVISRPGEKLETLVKSFPNIDAYPADLSSPDQLTWVADNIMRRYPAIDILINNAAVQNTPTLLDSDFCYDSMLSEINLNFTAVCALSYLLLPALSENPNAAAILNINSGLGLLPKTQSAVYCATKAAMNAFSLSLGYQLEQTNIRVVQAFLPLVDTPMTQGRGSNKMSVEAAANAILRGLQQEKIKIDIGKVKLLRWLIRIVPGVAKNIMKKG